MVWAVGASSVPGVNEKKKFTFYLGTHMASWLWTMDVPLFVSVRRLAMVRKLKERANSTPWSMDSGGFTELNLFGRWDTSVKDYVSQVDRAAREIGSMDWASPMDWMCEPVVLKKTGLTVEEHQRRTVDNFLELRASRVGDRIIPVLQGWKSGDYARCRDLYDRAGVDLSLEKAVGVGTVCRRQSSTEAIGIFKSLSDLRLHGFGVKGGGLRNYRAHLSSADSMSWSFGARRRRVRLEGHSHLTCANCDVYARKWYEGILLNCP